MRPRNDDNEVDDDEEAARRSSLRRPRHKSSTSHVEHEHSVNQPRGKERQLRDRYTKDGAPEGA